MVSANKVMVASVLKECNHIRILSLPNGTVGLQENRTYI